MTPESEPSSDGSSRPRRLYQVFISSPADVRPERAIAARVVAKLARELAHYCDVAPVLWERVPLVATSHFQDSENIPPPRATEICVVILWSRLGFPLPPEKFRGAISGRPVTGTEWEFENALAGFQEQETPDLLLYQKNADVVASLSDEAAFDELRLQRHMVADFLDRWFMSPDRKTFTAASHVFSDVAAFEDLLEDHLRVLLRRRLERDLGFSAAADAITWTEPPWPALASFDVTQAPVFFGRTRARNEVRELLSRQVQAGIAFVLVLGASGSGKSSLVKAGLLPDLMLPGMIGEVALVRHAIARPTDAADPLLSLAASMLSATALPELMDLAYTAETLAAQLWAQPAQAAFAAKQGLGEAARGKLTSRGQARLVVLVDQLEELFTAEGITPEARRIFVAVLSVLARSGSVWVIATFRADFFSKLELLPELATVSEGGRYLLLPPTVPEFFEIVRRPARAAGLRFEISQATAEGLDDAIVNAAARNPASLPLLSFALDRLWRQPRPSAELTFQAYAELGALEGAIAHHAEGSVSNLPADAQAALPGVLLAMVTLREGESEATGRACRLTDLAKSPASALVIDRLITARLVIVDHAPQGATVRLAHEALISRWPRLATLIHESHETLASITRLRAEFAEWDRNQKRPDLLLPPGKRLQEGADLLDRRREDLEDPLVQFIAASIGVAGAAARRRNRLLFGAFTVLSVLLIAAGIGAWFGFSGEARAQRQFELAEGRRAKILALALKNEDDPNVVEAVALSALSYQTNTRGNVATRSDLVESLLVAANANTERMVLIHLGKVTSAVFSPDGLRILTASVDGKARIWDASTGALLTTLSGHQGYVDSAAFSPDGRRIVTASGDQTARLWNADSGALLKILSGHERSVNSAAFSPDGRRVVTASDDRTARVWDAESGALLVTIRGHSDEVNSAAYSPDGLRIVTGSADKTARIWEASSGHLVATLTGHYDAVYSATFSRDGKRIITASEDETARIWDAANFTLLKVLADHNEGLSSAAFSPDSARIVTTSFDNTARLWDAVNYGTIAVMTVPGTFISSAAFSPDGLRIITGSGDNTARVWDAASGGHVTILAGHNALVRTAAYSPDGRFIVTASVDNTARVWSVRGDLITSLDGHEERLTNASFSPDGKRVVTASGDKTARIWDARTGRQLVILAGHDAWVSSAAFSPDGRRIVTASLDETARVWDAASGRLLVAPFKHDGPVHRAVFTPDGSKLVTVAETGVHMWDVATGALLRVFPGSRYLTNVAVSPDGTRIAAPSSDFTTYVWDTESQKLLKTLTGHQGIVWSADFSPDGRRIVTASDDKTVRVWDTESGALLLTLTGHEAAVGSAAFSPDGKHIVSAAADNTARIWDAADYLGPGDISFIRAIASRSVDAGLRAQYALADQPQISPVLQVPQCGRPADLPAIFAGPADLAAWRKGADSGSANCHQRLAEYFGDGPSANRDIERAFLHHALAARLLEEQGYPSAAQYERYRREAFAWMLPRQKVSQLMMEAQGWAAGAR